MTEISPLQNTTSGYLSANTINDNNDKVELAVQNSLGRKAPTDGTSNSMETTIDMNSNRVINLGTPVNDADAVTKKYVDDNVGDAYTYSLNAAASAAAALLSENNAAASEAQTGLDVIATGAVLSDAGFVAVSADLTGPNTIGAVASNSVNINAVAGNQANIDAVAGDVTNINLVASDLTNIDAVATDLANVDLVAADLTNVNAVAADLTNIDSVATNLTNINAVNANASNINAVVANAANINTVATDSTSINSVASSIANVNSVASDLTNINNVAADLTNIDLVATDLTNIDLVAADLTNIDIVAGDITNVNTVATDITNVNLVATDITNVNTVATNIADVNTCATNMAAIIAAPTEASNAAASADEAESYAAQAQASSGYSFKNKIIGGNFATNRWTKGTSLTLSSSAGNSSFPDNWSVSNQTDGAITVSRITGFGDQGNGRFSSYACKINVDTADTSIGSSQYVLISQNIEANSITGAGFGVGGTRYINISCLLKSNVTGTLCISFINSAYNRSYVKEVSVTGYDTVQLVNFSIPVDTTGTWLTAEGTVGLRMGMVLCSGSTFQTTPDAWTTGNYIATSNQTNFLAAQNNYIAFDLVQVECGSVATPFEYRDYATEEKLQDRYLPVIKPTGGLYSVIGSGQCTGTKTANVFIPFKNKSYKTPTGLVASGANYFYLYNATASVIQTSYCAFSISGQDAAMVTMGVASGLVAGNSTICIGADNATGIYFTGAECA